jgi:pectate lyase
MHLRYSTWKGRTMRVSMAAAIALAILLLPSCMHTRAFAQQRAFPGAEGYGAYASGGRGGMVYVVTNLLDSLTNPPVGSIRWALSDTSNLLPRTIVFRVSGTIELQGRLDVGRNNASGKCIVNNITIAGQTAPGDGICLRRHTLKVYATNVIIRHIKFRPGDETHANSPAVYGIDVENARNVIVDHCSMSWSIEEAATFYDDRDITVQWCFITESLNTSYNSKGAHGYGGVWGGQYGTYHHNLLAHHYSRTPRFNGARAHDTTAIVDFRNNVIYNWGNAEGCHGGEVEIAGVGSSCINMINNYFKPGPATPAGAKSYLIAKPYDSTSDLSSRRLSRWYIAGNYVTGSPTVTADNWNGGIQPKYPAKWAAASFRADTMFTVAPVVTQSAEDAYGAVLAGAGATLPRRDSVDARIVREVTSGTATYGTGGLINSQTDVGGWPLYQSLPAPPDADSDGMPDTWEKAHGLNPSDPADRNVVAPSGYTMLEEYLNGINGQTGISAIDESAGTPKSFALAQNYPNPFNPKTGIRYQVSGFSDVKLAVYDMLGREVEVLVNGRKEPGVYQVEFDGGGLPSGAYLCRLTAGTFVQTRRLLLLR